MRCNRWFTLMSIAAVMVCSSMRDVVRAEAKRPLYDKTFFEPIEEVVTPHIPWAKPYYRGPIRALFITHRDAMREVVEIAQRLDLDYKVFAGEGPDKFGETGIGVDMGWRLIRGNSAEELAARLQDNLKADYDVIVIGNFKWDALPIDCRYEILKKVKAGAGLCGFMPRGRDEYINRLLPAQDFAWTWSVWTGAANGVPDWLGKGDFIGKVDRNVKHSGETSVRIEGKEAIPGSHETPRAGYNFGPIKVQVNTQYRFSVWYRTAGLPDSKAMALVLPAPPGGMWLPASAEWKKHEVAFNSGPNTSLQCYLLNFGVGTVWYDDVSLVKVGEEDKELLPNPGLEQPGEPAPDFIVSGFPFASLPAFQNYKDIEDFGSAVVQTAHFRKGRLAFLRGINVPSHQMMTSGTGVRPLEAKPLDYDYYLALALRTILWAAGKEPEVTVSVASPPLVSKDRMRLAEEPIEFLLRNGRSAMQADLAFVLRDRNNRLVHKAAQKLSIASGESKVRFKLPKVPAGSYFADLWVKQNDKVAGWGSVGINVTSGSFIKEVALSADSFKREDPVRGKVTITNPAAGQSLEVTVSDNFGRLVARKKIPLVAAEDSLEFELRASNPLTIVQHLQARLLAGSDVLDSKETRFSLTNFNPDREDIRFVMWTGFPQDDFTGRLMAHEYYRNGVDTQYTGFSEWGPVENLWHLPYAARFIDNKTDWYQPQPTRKKDDLVRDPCLTNPDYLKTVRADLTRAAQSVGKFSSNDFALGDECHFVGGDYDLCFSPTCIADFKRFVREEYGDLDKLNREWKTEFKSWEEVTPIPFDEAQKTGSIARWVDHRRHTETVWASIYKFSREVIREVVPDARTGYEGSDTEVGSFHANDYWKLDHSMNLNNIYFRDFLLNAVRDFADPDTLLGGGWYGGYPGCRNEPFMRWFPWMTLFKGANSFWVWYGSDGAGAVMSPDLSLYPFFKANVQELAEIKGGVGKMLMSSQRQHDGIAMLYSPSSIHVATFTKGFPSMDQILDRTTQILHDCGLECRVLSYEELKSGKLTNEEFKVLLLPGCQALSPGEVERVTRFVQNGGTVIADLRPAVRNEHGTPYTQGALDDLFGVRQNTTEFIAKEGEPNLTAGLNDFRFKGIMTSTIADGTLSITQGQSLGKVKDTPALVINRFGKGQGVLLNFTLPRSVPGAKKNEDPNFRGWSEDAAMREFFAQLMRLGGVRRSVTVVPELPKVEVSRFRNGGIEYVGIVQGLPIDTLLYTNKEAELPPAKPVKILLPRKAHVYDVRAHRYLGLIDSVNTELQPGGAKLYALLPYKVSSVNLSFKGNVASLRQGDTLSYSVEVRAGNAKPGAHVVRLRVFDPKRDEARWYARNVLIKDGRAAGRLQLALNETAGKWTIEAMDVASGEKTSVQFNVLPGKGGNS